MLVDRICVLSIGHLLAPTLANCALFLTLYMSISFRFGSASKGVMFSHRRDLCSCRLQSWKLSTTRKAMT
jgi:hypothetical protein